MYQEFLNQAISKYEAKYTSYYTVLEGQLQKDANTLEELIAEEGRLKQMLTAAAKMSPEALDVDIPSMIREQYKERLDKYAQDKDALQKESEEALKAAQAEHDAKVDAATKKAYAGVQPLIDKHNRLLSYKDRIEDLCLRYSIAPGDIVISPDITASEYDRLLDAAILGCEQMLKQSQSKFNPLIYLYKPLEWDDWKWKFGALCGFSIAFHFIGGLLAVVIYTLMFISTIGVYKRLDKVKIASSLMYTPDFDRFMQRDEIEAVADVDVEALTSKLNADLAEIEKENPDSELSEALKEVNRHIPEITELIQQSTNGVKKKHLELMTKIQFAISDVTKRKNEEISKIKGLGSSMLDETPHTYPSNKYYLGYIKDVIPQRVQVPTNNYHFDSTATGMLDFMKLMLCNALLDIKEKKLTVIIVDPEGLGRDFAEFFNREKDTMNFIKLSRGSVEQSVQDIKTTLIDNIRKCGNRSIDDVNKEFEEKGMTTIDNYLVILASGQGDYCRKQENAQFITNSYKYGLRIWDYSPTKIDGLMNFEKPFEDIQVEKPMEYTYQLGVQCANTFADAVINSKDGSIDYFTSIQERYIPRDKWGTWSSNTGIELNFGLADGDPSKGYPIVLGDANVHCLMGGQSGAGKSAAINQMLLSLLTKYSPRELMLVMIDFKNVEFSTFTREDPKSGNKYSIIPHARIMAGTKDGEYALSIFDFLIKEMENRQRVFGGVKQKKLEDYNNLMREQGHPEKCLPRILLLIDEFQVMFTEVDRKIVEKIQDRIRSLAKLARAFGCHMWFTSQSMAGTMTADVMANFSMRAALRCTADVSNQIIGNGAAGNIKAKFGFLITNDSTGQDPSRNTTWRVPFVSTKNILKVMNESAEMYARQGMTGYNAIFYDEDQMYPPKKLFDFYDEHKDNPGVTNKHLIVLGERTNFSTNSAPVNFYLEKGDLQNMLVGGSEDKDMLNMFMTFGDNADAHGVRYIVSCADADAHQLLELDTRLKGPFLDWSYPNVEFERWIDRDESPIVALIEKREGMEEPNYDPVFILCYCWDKYEGFGVNESRYINKFKDLLRRAPVVDVHFIMFIKSRGEIGPAMYAMFAHHIGCLSDETLSYKLVDSTKANKLPNAGGFGIYKQGNNENKFKIYQHIFSRKLADKELKL